MRLYAPFSIVYMWVKYSLFSTNCMPLNQYQPRPMLHDDSHESNSIVSLSCNLQSGMEQPMSDPASHARIAKEPRASPSSNKLYDDSPFSYITQHQKMNAAAL